MEAVELLRAGVRASFVTLSATLPEQSALVVEHDLEPVVCARETLEALSAAATRAGRRVRVHLKVDTGMGRVGIRPEEVDAFLTHCKSLPGLRVRGLMSHFPRADEADKSFSRRQIEVFARLCQVARAAGVEVCHMANSAAIFDLPESHLDVVRPGISIYGLRPSGAIANPRVAELEPVLEWKTRVTFLKEVPAGTGLGYGHTFVATRPSLVATLPVGYGDGLTRRLSNRMEVLVGGVRCPQVGVISMDQSMVDVTALRGRVAPGDEAVLIGAQGGQTIDAAELAEKLGTISYEIVTAISQRVPRVVVSGSKGPSAAHE
jgi:alanine racemase